MIAFFVFVPALPQPIKKLMEMSEYLDAPKEWLMNVVLVRGAEN